MLSSQSWCFRMQVWDEGGNGYVRYSAAQVGRDDMGYVAENRVLQAALMRRLKDLENITLLWPVGCSQTYNGHVHAQLILSAICNDELQQIKTGHVVQASLEELTLPSYALEAHEGRPITHVQHSWFFDIAAFGSAVLMRSHVQSFSHMYLKLPFRSGHKCSS